MLQDSNLRLGGIYEIFQNVTESNRYSTSCHVIDHYTKHKFYWGFDTSIADMGNHIHFILLRVFEIRFPILDIQLPQVLFTFQKFRNHFDSIQSVTEATLPLIVILTLNQPSGAPDIWKRIV